MLIYAERRKKNLTHRITYAHVDSSTQQSETRMGEKEKSVLNENKENDPFITECDDLYKFVCVESIAVLQKKERKKLHTI